MSRIFRSVLSFFAFVSFFKAEAQEPVYDYTLSWKAPHTHQYHISLTTEPQKGSFTLFQLPNWRPGRYYLQDFAAGVSHFEALDESGQILSWEKSTPYSWKVQNPVEGTINIRYQFYANLMDSGSSVLNNTQAYFNGINLFMCVEGRYEAPCKLSVPSMPKDWKAATSLDRKANQHNVFYAESYHDLLDAPTILSPSLKTLHTEVDGADYYFHFQGRFLAGTDGEKALLENAGKIIREQSAIFGGVPMEAYHFIFQLVPRPASHAVEHKFSAMFMRQDSAFSSPKRIGSVNGILSHEFFHLWNVKRIRPAAMWPYDYQREAFTSLHWFTEGVTNYYARLTQVRAGLFAESSYLGILARFLTNLENDYAAKAISPHTASLNSWLSRSDYTNPSLKISYYSLGDRAGLLLDLELRRITKGQKSLDDVFRYLYDHYYLQNQGVPEDGIQLACESVSGHSFESFFEQYVQGTSPIPYKRLLEPMGLQMSSHMDTTAGLAHIGIKRSRPLSTSLQLLSVVPGSDAEQAGLGDDSIILSINGQIPTEFNANAFFTDDKINKKLRLKVYENGIRQEVIVPWSGKNIRYNYRISKIENPSAQQEAMLKDWLSSKVKN